MRLFVVVPFHNEEASITSALEALAAQSDRDFEVLCVDNASTDRGADLVRAFAGANRNMRVEVIAEPEKGTGAASDTGFRHAISAGATHVLRTDADCRPDPHWVANIRAAFAAGAEFVAGRIEPLRDGHYRRADGIVLPLLITVVQLYARLFRRGRGYLTGWVLVAGNNLGVEAALYERSGGFPRTELSQANEDRIFADRARLVTGRIVRRADVVVYNSVRRVRAYGYVNTLLWYWDRKYRPEVVDIR